MVVRFGQVILASLLLVLASCSSSKPVSGFTPAPSPSDTPVDAGQSGTLADSGEAPPALDPTDAGGDACHKVSDTETKCDGIDDDCNGKIDDVDVGKDGICDCIRIGLVGKKGWYGSNNFQQWLESKGTTVTRIQETTTETLNTTQLGAFDMVILEWLQRSYTAAEAQDFKTWLGGRHGVLALSGFAPAYDPTLPNSLLSVIGLQFTGSMTFPDKMAITDFSPHPLTVNVQSVTFNGGSEVLDTPAAVAGLHTTFARSSGRAVGVAHDDPAGPRGVAWGDEWIEFDSEWSTIPDITRFWTNIVSYLAPRCEVPPPPK
jgi:hypothetical protein